MPFSRERFNKMLDVAQVGIDQLFSIQREALGGLM
jgi:ribonuclease PH